MALLMSTLALPWYSSPEKSNILFHYVFFGRSSIFLSFFWVECEDDDNDDDDDARQECCCFLLVTDMVLGYLYSSCLAFFWVECEDDDNDDDDDARQECCCFLLVTDMVCSSHGGWVNASE
ncbi:hypothetical protein GQR58_022480 [Nymphon striatum]|nr:hypothetical protein GQR58_022480 [Nymphon striatum]